MKCVWLLAAMSAIATICPWSVSSAADIAAPTTQPIPAVTENDFLRYTEEGPDNARLETADQSYVNSGGVIVHLVAAVHIGEKSYYDGLKREFEKRDAVLYEMVKSKDTPVPAPGESTGNSTNPISEMQRFMKDVLNLQFQLDCIDYTRPNFIHADLDAETFHRLQEERGETFEMLFIKSLVRAMSQPAPDDNAQATDTTDQTIDELIRTVTRPDPERRMKRMLAKQMTQVEGDAIGVGSPYGTVLIGERNKAAFAALKSALSSGKKDIAIFYGAAHMPDMSSQLAEMGFKPVATEWRTAWDLNIRQDKPSAVESALMQIVHGFDDPN